MAPDPSHNHLHFMGRAISIAAMIGTVVIALLVVHQVNANPRTDDAEVFANFIGMAPLVNGPVTHLYVTDNQQVKAGDPLFDIDQRPYAYALARARSDQHALEGQISDERRIISAKSSGVDVARASALSAEASLAHAAAAVEQAKAELEYASNNLHRIEPLLERQFVTVDQVDQARTLQVSRSQGANQATSQLALAEAGLLASEAQYKQAQAVVEESHQQVQQASHSVTTLEPLQGQLSGKQAAIDTAKYNLDNCRVISPFD